MPTEEEWEELLNNTTNTWTTQNGVNGWLFTAANGNSVFLPAAGYRDASDLILDGYNGAYWSSSLYTDNPGHASVLEFDPNNIVNQHYFRHFGHSVRPVRSPQTEHAYVDLGLPSGTKWATCNVGADSPEDYGDYFAWGETTPKDTYTEENYTYSENPAILPSNHDAATANWGPDWRIPTKQEWQELYNNTTHTWTTQNGVNGRLFTASNGNSLFLPAAGWRFFYNHDGVSFGGVFWSSSLGTYGPWLLTFAEGGCSTLDDYLERYYGLTVRAVRVGSQN